MRRASVIVITLAVALASAQPAASQTSAAAARIEIPRLELSAPVGLAPYLDRGPGFYPGSGRPGGKRTIAIAGHRTTHTRPFFGLNELRRGNRIILRWRGSRYVYRVSGVRVVDKRDWSIVRELGVERLVLSACHPRGSSAKRVVAFAWPVRGNSRPGE